MRSNIKTAFEEYVSPENVPTITHKISETNFSFHVKYCTKGKV